MKIDNSLEEELLRFWKKPKVYRYNDDSRKLNNIICRPTFISISTLIFIVLICLYLEPKLSSNKNIDKNYIDMIIFLVLILFILLFTHYLNTSKNKLLFESKNLKLLYLFLFKRNIKESIEYEKLISRLQCKLDKVDKISLIDDSLSKMIIGVSSFIGGNFFRSYFNSNTSNITDDVINQYIVLLLVSILCICLYNFFLVSFNSFNTDDTNYLSLLIDDLQKIKLQIEIEESKENNRTNYDLELTKIEKCNLVLSNTNKRIQNKINSKNKI